jgi:fatty acid-binding protein DegV
MANVKIVTDSLADIPLALMKGLDITIIPCTVYNGPKNSDTKRGLNRVVKCHHAKTLF